MHRVRATPVPRGQARRTGSNEWQAAAIFWHAFIALLLLAMAVRRDLSNRVVAALLVLPLLSVSALAWLSNNPFNGAVFAALSLVLAAVALGLPEGRVRFASLPKVIAGVVLVAFGLIYPHFLEATHWSLYLIAAPLGLLPCPTLSAVMGLTLMMRGLRSTTWSLTLSGAAVLYATIGVFRLAVSIDIVLFAGAVALAASVVLRPRSALRIPHQWEELPHV